MINYVNYSKHFTFHKDKRRDCLETKLRMKHIRIKVHNHSRFWLSSQSSEQYLAEEAHDVWHQVKMTEESGKMSSKDCVTYRIWGEVLLPTLLFLLSSLFLLLHFLSPAPVFTSMVITWLNFHTCVLLTYPLLLDYLLETNIIHALPDDYRFGFTIKYKTNYKSKRRQTCTSHSYLYITLHLDGSHHHIITTRVNMF